MEESVMAIGVLRNWNRSAESRPAVIEHPATAGEIQRIVTETGQFPSPVRPAGEFHSVNPCFAADGGTQVCMDRFARRCVVDPAKSTITVSANVTLLEIRDALRPHRLELPVAPEIGNATAGSVACSGTKDSSLFERPPIRGDERALGFGFGQVGSAVTQVKMIDARGNDVTVTGAELVEIRSSYGLLGIIHEVTFQAQPLVAIHNVHEFIEFSADAPPSIRDIFGDAQAVLGFLQPYRPGILVERRTLAPNAEPTVSDQVKRKVRDWLWEWGASEGTTALSTAGRLLDPLFQHHALGFLSGAIERAMDRMRHAEHPATNKLLKVFDELAPEILHDLHGYTAFRSDSTIDFTRDRETFFDFTFWAFPVSRWDEVIRKYLAFCKDHLDATGFRPALFTEVYFIARDARSLLGFAPTEHVFTLDIVHNAPNAPEWMALNVKYDRFAASLNGRPLLNQTKQLDVAGVVGQVLPAWGSFKAKLRETSAFDRFCAGTFFDRI
jgi:hypothetical protein